jgi:hypothetical protein
VLTRTILGSDCSGSRSVLTGMAALGPVLGEDGEQARLGTILVAARASTAKWRNI